MHADRSTMFAPTLHPAIVDPACLLTGHNLTMRIQNPPPCRHSLPFQFPPFDIRRTLSHTKQCRQTKQSDDLANRVYELGRNNTSVGDISNNLHIEEFKTSRNGLWPPKTDGKVIVRLLLNKGINPVSGDPLIKKYATEYAATLRRDGEPMSLGGDLMAPTPSAEEEAAAGLIALIARATPPKPNLIIKYNLRTVYKNKYKYSGGLVCQRR